MKTHKPYCAKVIAMNAETPFAVRCDCQKKSEKKEMIKLHSAEDAIKQAIKGGWRPPWEIGDQSVLFTERYVLHSETAYSSGKSTPFEIIFTNPLFWQALGKVRNWTEEPMEIQGGILFDSLTVRGYDWETIFWEKGQPSFYAAQWFDTHVWHPDQETKFWESLN